MRYYNKIHPQYQLVRFASDNFFAYFIHEFYIDGIGKKIFPESWN